MRKVAALGLAIGLLAGSNAFAGLAIFSPETQNVLPGQQVQMDITLQAQQLPNFDSVDAIILSEVPFNFAYSDAFRALAIGFISDPPSPAGLGLPGLPNDLYTAGANSAVAGSLGSQVLYGTVTIDTTGLALGEYEVVINSDLDDGVTALGRQGTTEGIVGRGVFNVVPEPASLALLGLGAIGLIRRRLVG